MYFSSFSNYSHNTFLTCVYLYLQENDYNLNYFDNGEGYGADDDDDLDEGPTY